MSEDYLRALLALFLILVVGGLALLMAGWKCTAQWPTKYRPQFSPIVGCTIEVQGERIPAANYRVL